MKTQVFTPNDIVNEMLDIIDYSDNIFNKKVIDSACGEGNILVEVVERYVKNAKYLKKCDMDIKKGIEENIFGIEKDYICFLRCIKNLNLIAAKYNLLNVEWSIFNEDSLMKTFNFNFDYVIGNPPYLKYHDILENEREYIRSNFKTCKKGNFDYYYAFLEKDYHSLNSGGKLIYLIPNNTFKNVFAENLRSLIKNETLKIIDYKDIKIFKDALTSSSLLYIAKDSMTKQIEYINKKSKEKKQIDKINLGRLWYFDNDFNISIKSRETFGDYFHASMSVATLLNEAFIIKDYIVQGEEVIIGNEVIEKKALKNAVSPRNLNDNKKEFIIFPYSYRKYSIIRYEEEYFHLLYPNAYCYLNKFKEKLIRRKSNKNTQWFEYGRSQGLNKMNQKKIVVSTLITTKVKAYLVNKDAIVYSGIFIVPKRNLPLETAKSILESPEFFEYVKMVGVNTSGNSLRISAKDINRFPIKI